MKLSTILILPSIAATVSIGCEVVPDTCDDVNRCGDASVGVGDGNDTTDGTVPSDAAGPPDANWTCCEGGDAPTSGDGAADDAAADAAAQCGDASFCGAGAGCVDTTSSLANCGGCGHSCSPPSSNGSAACVNSSCIISCEPGYELCSGQCVNTTDIQSCGGCNNACPSADGGTATCVDGGCGLVCTTGYQACPQPDPTECVSENDPSHCGSCGKLCPGPTSGSGSATCSAGSCGLSCNAGQHSCNGACLPNIDDPSTDSCVVSSAYGVFVVAGGTGSGTQASPLGSIAAAMALAKSSGKDQVFVCAQGGPFTSIVSVGSSADGVTVYGGFTACPTTGSWTWTSGTKTAVAPTSGPALTVSGLTLGATFKYFSFTAQSAPATTPGASSIAVEVTNSTGDVDFVSSSFAAGSGTAGQPGTTPTSSLPPAVKGSDAATAANGGGAPTSSVICPNGTPSVGGGGGSGALYTDPANTATDGQNGQPTTGNPSNKGSAAANNMSVCSSGAVGASGGPGTDATSPTTNATLISGVWTPTGGIAGGYGGTGQGGGGGGGGYPSNALSPPLATEALAVDRAVAVGLGGPEAAAGAAVLGC